MNMNQQTLEEAFYILVVDDHDLRRQWMKHALKGAPFHVRTTASGRQGLRYLRQVRFDAVVIGEHLNGMGVKEFVEKVHRACPDTPLIVSPYTISSERHAMAGSQEPIIVWSLRQPLRRRHLEEWWRTRSVKKMPRGATRRN